MKEQSACWPVSCQNTSAELVILSINFNTTPLLKNAEQCLISEWTKSKTPLSIRASITVVSPLSKHPFPMSPQVLRYSQQVSSLSGLTIVPFLYLLLWLFTVLPSLDVYSPINSINSKRAHSSFKVPSSLTSTPRSLLSPTFIRPMRYLSFQFPSYRDSPYRHILLATFLSC